MLRLHLTLPLVMLALFFVTDTAFGVTTLRAILTNANENPDAVPTLVGGAPRPASFGVATFELNDAMTAMTMSATVHNIDFTGSQTADTNDNLTNAHIHASATVTPTTNAGVVWGFHGTPDNDIDPNDEVFTPFVNIVGGKVTSKWDAPEGNSGTTLALQLNNILTEHAYINFHTNQFGGGEIRGTLVIIPEPATLLLLAIGASALTLRRRTR